MSEVQRRMEAQLGKLNALAPLGYAAGIHIRFARPLHMRSTLPQSWQEIYVERSYHLRDPMLFWGMSNGGVVRWSEIALPDPFGVLTEAAMHGLRFGATASTGRITSRTVVGAARDDREFTDQEMAEIDEITHALHAATEPPSDLSDGQAAALRLLAEGYRIPAAAAELGIPEDQLRRRIGEARDHLGAATTAEAIKMARENRFI